MATVKVSAIIISVRKKIMRHLNFFLIKRIHMWSLNDSVFEGFGLSSKKE